MSDYVQLPPDGTGKKVECEYLPGEQAYRQVVTAHIAPGSSTLGTCDLVTDAWGVQKVSLPHSIFHGLFTFDIPPSQWFMYHGATQVYTSTLITSANGAATLTTSAAVPAVRLESRATPRYQPNRGHLYSTALWCPVATADATREWGMSTAENGVFFRLKPNGQLYAVLKSLGVETREELIDTSALPGFDVTKGHVYDIQYQWRGIGNYKFFVDLTEVHVFANLGTLQALSMADPALPATYTATRGTQDASIYIGCVDIASENGDDDRLQYGSSYAQKTVNGTDVPVICIYNPLQIHSKTNTRMTELSRITVTCDKKSLFKVWITRDPTAIVGATFVERGGGSHMQTDSPDSVTGAVSATSVVSAKLQLVTAIPLQANATKETNNPFQGRIDYPLVRGDYLVITNTVPTGACEVVVEWGEAI